MQVLQAFYGLFVGVIVVPVLNYRRLSKLMDPFRGR